MNKALIISSLLIFSAAGWAQRVEVTPFVGYKVGGDVPVEPERNDIDVKTIRFDDSVSAGVTVGFNVTEHFGLEFLWNRQPTKATGLLSGGGVFPTKADVDLDQYHGNFVYNFRDGDSKLRPFLLFGLGATRAAASDSSETRFSFGVGGGAKYFFHPNMGLRLQARWTPTYLYSTAGGVWCDWWGWCWVMPNDHYMNQGDFTAGWIFRF